MFTMGMTDNFTSHVSKDISGKKFYSDLSKEIEKFLPDNYYKVGILDFKDCPILIFNKFWKKNKK